MSLLPSFIIPKALLAALRRPPTSIKVSPVLIDASTSETQALLQKLETSPSGLTQEEAARRLEEHGLNVVVKEEHHKRLKLLGKAMVNPLVILLLLLAAATFATADGPADRAGGVIMLLMVVMGVSLRFIQEARADTAAAKLKAMIHVTATVVRDTQPGEVPLAELAPGDIVKLAAGDMIPADVRIIASKDLFLIQSSLTGESLPVEKFDAADTRKDRQALDLSNICFLGTTVESGTATAVVVQTGLKTYLGGMASAIIGQQVVTAFDKGISRFTWLMIRFMGVMVPLVFLINFITKIDVEHPEKFNRFDSALNHAIHSLTGIVMSGHHDLKLTFLFTIAVAVGLTPEMLPMIVSVCLSRGAIGMSKKKVIVKRLNSIQNFGAMDVLCTDKTGTLTIDRVIMERYCDVVRKEDDGVLVQAYLNSFFQTGLKNVLDRAILEHKDLREEAAIHAYKKIDEIPFDFARRRMSVVVETPESKHRLICKGAPEAIFDRCTQFELDGELLPMDPILIDDLKEEYDQLSTDGFRVLALAYRDMEKKPAYARDDERDMVLKGYVAFLDPPKDTAAPAIVALRNHGISMKVLTGDNDLVSRKICSVVGIPTDHVLVGSQVEAMTDAELANAAEATTLFARLSPAHKQRVIRALQSKGHVVGFLGDGINDAPALRAADVGISVDSAVDIAKESADVILLEKSLMVLEEGVLEGRKVFANILKYVRMGASSNFGNMFSMLGASALLPFVPMAPKQILVNNMLYDISQVPIPNDEVDPEQIVKPRPWSLSEITRFILFIGPISSIFDYTTYGVMWWLFGCGRAALHCPAALVEMVRGMLDNDTLVRLAQDPAGLALAIDAQYRAALFQTGWFVESLLTQTLIIHVIRTNRIPFIQSRASWPLITTTAAVMLCGIWLPFSPWGYLVNFVPLPHLFWPVLAGTLMSYMILTQLVKVLLVRKKWI